VALEKDIEKHWLQKKPEKRKEETIAGLYILYYTYTALRVECQSLIWQEQTPAVE